MGVLIGVWLAARDAPRAGLPPVKIWNLCIYGIIVALVASKLWLILSDWHYYAANPAEIFSSATLESGGTFYGGVIGGILWTFFYTRREKLPPLSTFDVCAAPLAIGHALGRVGCFMAGNLAGEGDAPRQRRWLAKAAAGDEADDASEGVTDGEGRCADVKGRKRRQLLAARVEEGPEDAADHASVKGAA